MNSDESTPVDSKYPVEELDPELVARMQNIVSRMPPIHTALVRQSVLMNVAFVAGQVGIERMQYVVGGEVFQPDWYGHIAVFHPNSPIIVEAVDDYELTQGLGRNFFSTRITGFDQNLSLKFFGMPVLRGKFYLLVDNPLITLEQIIGKMEPKVAEEAIRTLRQVQEGREP